MSIAVPFDSGTIRRFFAGGCPRLGRRSVRDRTPLWPEI